MKHLTSPGIFFTIVALCITTSLFSQKLPATSKTKGVSRIANACGVVASFTPDHDSILSGPIYLPFTNTTTNATKVTWYVNGWWNSTSNTFSFGNSTPGMYQIELVATNG